MQLDGFGIAGYRSFGPELQKIDNLGKVNVFIGKNNCGKSNILRFIEHIGQLQIGVEYNRFNDLDYHRPLVNKNIYYSILIKRNGAASQDQYQRLLERAPFWENAFPELKKSLWITLKAGKADRNEHPFRKDIKTYFDKKTQSVQDQLSSGIIATSPYDHRLLDDISGRLLTSIGKEKFDVFSIDAMRQINSPTATNFLSGKGFIDEMSTYENPSLDNYGLKKKQWNEMNKFIQNILNEPTAQMTIPFDRKHILLTINGKTLPLDSLGTGVHQLLLMTAAVTLRNNVAFCIEEPETNLHPEILKRFMHYIVYNTDNQYFITSHSSACIDVPGIEIYECVLDSTKGTQVKKIQTRDDQWKLITDLGYKASDVLQPNYVLWVEGPSDRIYLKNWITKTDSQIEEGIHYCILFIGGCSTAKYLAFDDSVSDAVISLSKICRNAGIILDSDKDSASKALDGEKDRLAKEFESQKRFAWITDGYAIENYLDERTYSAAIGKILNGASLLNPLTQFSNPCELSNNRKFKRKIEIAEEVIRTCPLPTAFDFTRNLDQLIHAIKAENGLS